MEQQGQQQAQNVPQGFGPPPPPYAPTPYAPQQEQFQQPFPGPEFLAADRRFAIVIDEAGVCFESQGHTAEFPWHDITTVHYKQGTSGHILMVGVVLTDGRFLDCAVVAKNRGMLQEWFEEIAPVLGEYLGNRGAPGNTNR
ncbi:hypothetical protein ABCR94_23970 [Streptomyces sp. 21So2-11]|uniref:hypothetical protein n=1 Tax=Streptomyces sp. 21So2-11 TaxID=3144408 RepID=UPI00321983F9